MKSLFRGADRSFARKVDVALAFIPSSIGSCRLCIRNSCGETDQDTQEAQQIRYQECRRHRGGRKAALPPESPQEQASRVAILAFNLRASPFLLLDLLDSPLSTPEQY
jgi:hypothetical protein